MNNISIYLVGWIVSSSIAAFGAYKIGNKIGFKTGMEVCKNIIEEEIHYLKHPEDNANKKVDE